MIRYIALVALVYYFMPGIIAEAQTVERKAHAYEVYQHNVSVVAMSPAMRLPVVRK